ncbi:MAG: peroxidase, partial [Verrucomicrobiota bacterium]
QFEFMQQVWANNPRFNGLSGSRDPLIGDNGHPDDPSALHIPGNNHDWRTAPLPRFVTVRGGAYLFMPGKRAMTFLARRRA